MIFRGWGEGTVEEGRKEGSSRASRKTMAEEGGRKVFVIAVFYFFSVCRGWLGRGESRFRLDGATRGSQGAGGGGRR